MLNTRVVSNDLRGTGGCQAPNLGLGRSSLCRSIRPFLTLFALVALALPAVVSRVNADDATNPVVFRPQTFVRTKGNPNSYTATFKVPGWVVAPFNMHVVNGNPDGRERVSSATVVLNGVQVLGPSDLSQSVGTLDVPASPVTGDNTLQVTLSGTPGAEITITISATNADQVPPQVTIVTPANGSFINTATPRIQITYSKAPGFDDDRHSECDETTLKITLDGVDRTKLFTIRKGDATATIPASLALTPGLHTLVATLYNEARIQGSATSQFTVVLNAPTIQIVQPVLGAYLNTTTPAITIQYSASGGINLSSLKVLVNGADLSSLFTKTNTNATATLPPANALPQGANQIVASIQDLAGNQASASTSFNTDTTPPTVSFSHPVPSSYFGSSTVAVAVQYADDQAIDPTQLKVTVDGIALPMTALPTSATGTASGLANGAHLLLATIKDLAGNAASAQITFYVDTTIPTIHISQPASNALLNTHTPQVMIDYTDVGGVDLTTLNVLVNGANASSLFTATSTSASAQLTSAFALPDGQNTITAQIANLAGSVGTATSTFLVDTTPPTIAIQAPSARTNSNAPTVTITYSDATSGVNPYSLVVTLDGADISSLVAPGASSATGVLQLNPPLADGTHVLTASVKDRAGNQSLPASFSFVVDTQPPTASFTAPVDNSFLNNPTPTMSLHYSDGTGTGVDTTLIRVFLQQGTNPATDITNYFQIAAQQATGAIPSAASLSDGTYTLSAVVNDLLGNSANAHATFVVDTVPPTGTIQAPAANAILNTSSVMMSLLYQDDRSGVDTSKLVLTVDGVNETSVLTLSPTQATGLLPTLADGVHTVQLTIFDRSGNSSGVISQTFETDTTPPAISAAALPVPNVAGWNNSPVTVTFSCGDSVSGVANCPSPVVVTTDGANQLVAGTVTDNAGNSATASVTVNLDRTPPTITATATPAPNASGINTTDVTVTFACSDATSGIVSCPPPQTVTTQGTNQVISGTATDKAGNVATASVTLTILKNQAPPPTITAALSPAPNGSGWNNSPVTVTFTCSGGGGGIASCTSPVTVSTEGANQVVTGTAVDQAGQIATASVTVNLDLSPPAITATVSPSPNAAGWNNSNVTVSFQCKDSLSGVASCPAAVQVTTEGATVVTSQPAMDSAGNTATASVLAQLDKTAPAITITSPIAGSNVYAVQTTVSGTVSDALSGVSGVTCNGVAAQVNGGAFSCAVNLTTGADTISATAVDAAGNAASASTSVTLVPAPVVTITSPANLSYGNFSPITVRGTVNDPNATVTINGAAAGSSGGTFSLSVPLVEGTNTLTAVATNIGGNQGSASVVVTLDTTPPHVTIDFPPSGSITTDSAVSVTGLVNDIVVGTVNDQNAKVTVNGVPVQVANRSYSAANVPLNLGANTIQAVAVDQAGNATTVTSTVTRVAANQPPPTAAGQAVITQSLSIISGNNQSGAIGTQLTTPLVVSLQDLSGNPVANQPVVFQVTGDSSTLSPSGGAGSSSAQVNTNSAGQAQVFWTLGQRAGTGTNTLQVSSPLAIAPEYFAATALSGPAAQIVVDSGDDQSGTAGQALIFPLVAVVTDAGHNRIPNVPVTLRVVAGGGSFNGVASQVINSDSDGRVQAVFTLGLQAGANNNVVEATFPGNTGSVVAFSASGRIAGNPANTTISGVVLDNSDNPIPNVTMRLYKTNQASSNNLPVQIGTPAQTDATGHFLIPNAPFGYFKLMADGSTATVTSKSFPTLEYDIVTVAGQDNNVGTPIYLPVLNTINQLCVDASHGGTLTLPEAPGFALTVPPGSATFPGGSRQGCVSVSLVHGDKVPMPPGFGQQPRFIVTIQPVGTTFNPPAPITLPNVDGLPPRHVTEMYSYDHDLSMFVAIGTGTVSADGSAIASDPGVGVLKAGWHCGGDPNSAGSVGHCNDCAAVSGSQCVPTVQSKINAVPCTDFTRNTIPIPEVQADGSFEDESHIVGEYIAENIGTDNASVKVAIADSCFGECDGNGNCGPNEQNGFDTASIASALSVALNKIFDNSQNSCLPPDLRLTSQRALSSNGITIQCNSTAKDCADTDLCSNVITLNPKLLKAGCNDIGTPSVIFHELLHGPGCEAGAPAHNGAGNVPIDCTDRVYGCQALCFPGSTDGYVNNANTGANGGNEAACYLSPLQAQMENCGTCVPVTFPDQNGQLHTVQNCPSTVTHLGCINCSP